MADLKPAEDTIITPARRIRPRPGIFAVLALVAIIALVLIVAHGKNRTNLSSDNPSPASPQFAKYNTAAAVANPNRTFKLVVNHEEHKLTSGPSAISLKQGDVVDITVFSDEDENRVNLEYYDVTTEAGNNADSVGHIKFVAYKTGTYKISDLGDEENPFPPGKYVLSTVEVK